MRYISLFIFLFFLSYSSFQNKLFSQEQPYIETMATYTKEVSPDIIKLSISISEADSKGKTNLEQLENQMIKSLLSIGVDPKKQLTIDNLSSRFQNYVFKKDDIIKSKSFLLTINSPNLAAKVISNLDLLNISQIGVKSTTYSKLEVLKQELRKEAVEKAKKQASVMASALDQEVGKAILISDVNTSGIQSLNSNSLRIRGTNSVLKTTNLNNSLEFEKIRVESTIYVKFKLE